MLFRKCWYPLTRLYCVINLKGTNLTAAKRSSNHYDEPDCGAALLLWAVTLISIGEVSEERALLAVIKLQAGEVRSRCSECGNITWRRCLVTCVGLLRVTVVESNNNDNKDKKFWEELIAYVPLIRQGPHRKRKNYGEVIYRHTDSKVIS
jgi:predicted RNA-binding Zn-ribbon protein involved in translation (DUF1610 family)